MEPPLLAGSFGDLQTYTLAEMRAATDDFAPAAQIGEGGFGAVYRGRLRGGVEVAIKKLSPDSLQVRAPAPHLAS